MPYIWLEQANATLLPVQVPGLTNAEMIVQRVGPVLGQDSHIGDTRVHAITEGKINDAVLTGERYGGGASCQRRWCGRRSGESAKRTGDFVAPGTPLSAPLWHH